MAKFTDLTINDTGSLKVSTGTTAQRPATPTPGQLRFNQTNQVVEGYNDVIAEFRHQNVRQENIYTSTNLVLWLDAGDRASYSGSGTQWKDLSNRGNNATLTGTYSFTEQNSGAIAFSSSSRGYANIPSTSDFAFGTADFTWEVWIYQRDLPSYGHLIAFPGQNTACLKTNIISGTNGTDLYFYTPGGSTFGATPGWNTALNHWSHVVLSRRSGRFYTYINGLEIADTASGAGYNATAQACNIGDGIDVGEFTNKNIAVVRVYKGEGLTLAQVSQNYNAQKDRFGHQGFRYQQDIPTKGLRTYIDFANPTCYTGYTDFVNDLSPLYNNEYTRGNNGVFLYSSGNKPQYLYSGAEGFHGAVYNANANAGLALRNILNFAYVSVIMWFRWNGDSNVEDILFNKENDWEVNTNGGTLNMAHYTNNQSWFWDDTNGRLDSFYPNFHAHTYDGSAVRSWCNGYQSQNYGYPANGVNFQPSTYTKFWERGGNFSFEDQSDSIHTIYQILIYDRALDDWEIKKLWELGSHKFMDSPR